MEAIKKTSKYTLVVETQGLKEYISSNSLYEVTELINKTLKETVLGYDSSQNLKANAIIKRMQKTEVNDFTLFKVGKSIIRIDKNR